MASLTDLLKAKKEAAKYCVAGEAVGKLRAEGKELGTLGTIDLEAFETAYVYTPVDESLFLACYTVLICNPYACPITDFRAYRDFLLGDAQYVLNTFSHLDSIKLLRLYLIHHPIQEPKHLQSLSSSLWELELCVPGFFQDRIERLIIKSNTKKNFLIDKLPDFS